MFINLQLLLWTSLPLSQLDLETKCGLPAPEIANTCTGNRLVSKPVNDLKCGFDLQTPERSEKETGAPRFLSPDTLNSAEEVYESVFFYGPYSKMGLSNGLLNTTFKPPNRGGEVTYYLADGRTELIGGYQSIYFDTDPGRHTLPGRLPDDLSATKVQAGYKCISGKPTAVLLPPEGGKSPLFGYDVTPSFASTLPGN